MRNLLITIAIILTTISNAQTNFIWEKVIETKGTKQELYSKSKMFIAEVWNDSNSVIKNDDPNAGLILIKGIHTKNSKYLGVQYTYVFDYTIKIIMKDNKVKFIIQDVRNTDVYNTSVSGFPTFDVLDKEWNKKHRYSGLTKKKYISFINELKSEIGSIITTYENYLNSDVLSTNW